MSIPQAGKKRSLKTLLPLFLLVLSVVVMSMVLPNSFILHDGYADESKLANADCIKCHSAVQGVVDSKGAKHKTVIGCLDCHKGHPPMISKDKIIPVCADCHTGKPHYDIGGCRTCHTDPHAPLDIKLAVNLTAPCLSCHPAQGDEVKNYPSRHSKLFCTTCHKAHRDVPPCMSCHQPHSAEQTEKDCQMCHPAHKPLTISISPDMPNSQCAACHKGISDTLSAADTKHSAVACVACHKEKHKYVPACESCHGSPHPAGMLKQFPQCNMCHISAHSLGKEVKK